MWTRAILVASAVAWTVSPARASEIISPAVQADPAGSVVCLLSNLTGGTLEGIEVHIEDGTGGTVLDQFDGAINDRGTFFSSSTDDLATYCRWVFPASKKKVRASILVLDNLGRPRVAMPAE